jgi:hypothetical protein
MPTQGISALARNPEACTLTASERTYALALDPISLPESDNEPTR